MKQSALVATIAASLVLPAISYAGSDQVVDSFQRDLERKPSGVYYTASLDRERKREQKPVILWESTDPILISFERDLNRASHRAPSPTSSRGGPIAVAGK